MSDNNDWKKNFTDRLRRLRDPAGPDRATLAELRRCLGRDLARPLFRVGWLFNGVPDRALEDGILAAALFASHGAERRGVSLGGAFRALRERTNSDSVEKRFVALLDSAREDLPSRLRQAVSLLKAREVPLDWELLLTDLRRWDYPSRRVQRTWARDFWAEGTTAPPADAVGEPATPS